MKRIWLMGVCGGFLSWAAAAQAQPAQPKQAAPGTPVTVVVKPAAPAAPPVSLVLKTRQGQVTPHRSGFNHTGGGNIDVQQPSPDVVVVTMKGVAVAGPHPCGASAAALDFVLDQCVEVSFDDPAVKLAKLTVEGRLIGLLRSHRKGGTAEATGAAVVSGEGGAAVHVAMPSRSVGGGDNLSVNDFEGPIAASVGAGKYTLHQTFHVSASHCQGVCGKAAAAEFAPDPALNPLWISAWEPFNGAAKQDFGFQVTIRVADDTPKEPAKDNGGDKK